MKCNRLIVPFCLFLMWSCSKNYYSGFTKVEKKYFKATQLMIYSDSINSIETTSIIPKFLYDPQFDYSHKSAVPSPHTIIPKRKLILDLVTSCKSLKKVLDINQKEHKIKPHIQYNIVVDYSEYSFYDLIRKRYDKLKCSR
jgi:hypothetical protein